ncbi:MAG: hypothetical protein E7294_02350 [Lachnospiraceae bacterium]|nr:hypothetical protein [Lachnospiraceae bacterium]
MIKNKFGMFVVYCVMFTLFWNLMDYVHATVIMKGAFSFDPGRNLTEPLAIAVAVGYFLYLRKKDDK